MMFLPLLLAATQMAAPDTLLVPGVVLLGEEIETPTYYRESYDEMPSFAAFASMAQPMTDHPGFPEHPTASTADVGLSPAELDMAVWTVEDEMKRGAFPGAALAVGRWDRTVMERGVGTLDGGLGSPPVDPDYTIYDLASLTKVIATTSAVMLLVEDGKLNLYAPVSAYLPYFEGENKEWVTIRHLLTHTSGLPAGGSVAGETRLESYGRAASTPLRWTPGTHVEYSDIGFIVLWAAAEAAAGERLEDLLQRRVFGPLDMRSTGFRPGELCFRCAPTAPREGYRGIVHDPLARRLDGIAGNAGLFSTAHDLGRFAAMLASGGELDGVRVFSQATIDLFTQRQPGADTRALGWDTPDEWGRGAGGLRISPNAFGHTGFTGTSLWVDPVRGTWAVLLANRTYDPVGPNRMQSLRRELNDHVASAIDLHLN